MIGLFQCVHPGFGGAGKTDLARRPWRDKVRDHVLSDFAQGACVTLAKTPGTQRLDDHGDLDHRGVLCELTFP